MAVSLKNRQRNNTWWSIQNWVEGGYCKHGTCVLWHDNHLWGAEAAAQEKVLAVLDEQEREMTEFQRLVVKEKQWLARFEAERLARQHTIQDKHRKPAHLEEMKKLNAALLKERYIKRWMNVQKLWIYHWMISRRTWSWLEHCWLFDRQPWKPNRNKSQNHSAPTIMSITALSPKTKCISCAKHKLKRSIRRI